MILLGYDPGSSKNCNGIAIFEAGGKPRYETACVNSVGDAFDWFQKQLCGRTPFGAGIDTLMFWETGACGWRKADVWLRQEYPKASQSVVSANSARGSMCVQGVAMAMKLRETWPGIQLNETHPKVLYHALSGGAYDWGEPMQEWLTQEIGCDSQRCESDHAWDALISAWATFKGLTGDWRHDLRRKSRDALEPAGPVTYWWPE